MASTSSFHNHCEYVLLAEFDIDEGSVLRHEYPVSTGCDGHLLAELMLPDGAHQRTEDWTVFYLNQTRATTINRDLLNGVSERQSASIDNHSSIDHADRLSGGATSATGGSDLLYVMSLVRTKHGASYKRGALVKALAVCSPLPYIQIFKPVLLLALEEYFNEPTPAVLRRLYDSINSINTSLTPTLSLDERMVLRCSERKDIFAEKFTFADDTVLPVTPTNASGSQQQQHPIRENGRSSTEISNIRDDRPSRLGIPGSVSADVQPRSRVTSDSSAASVPGCTMPADPPAVGRAGISTLTRSKAPRDTHYFDTSVSYNDLQLPIRLPLDTFPDEIGEYSLITLISTFSNFTSTQGPQHSHLHTNGSLTPPIIVLFNAILTYKRVLFLGGASQPASQVSNFVLSAAALGSGCGTFFGRDTPERCFPYSNLTNLDNVLGVPGYIAGVSNPRFEDLTSTWDVLCNIETGRIHISKDIQQGPSYMASTYSASTNASQLSLSTSSTTTHSSVPASGSTHSAHGRSTGHNPSLSADFSTTASPEPISAVSGHLPFGPNGNGLGLGGLTGDDPTRGPAREASTTSSGGIMGGAPSTAPSLSSTTTASAANTSSTSQMPRVEARLDTFDNTFMDEIISMIQAHFGESVVRARFIEYMRRFVRLASRYEEETYGATTIDFVTLPFIPGRLGSGLVFYANSQEEIKRELNANAGRIEGWRRTKCYEAYKSDWMKSQTLQSQALLQQIGNLSLFPNSVPPSFIRAIKGVDLHHQISRLRNSKKMSAEEVEHITLMLKDGVKTDEQVIELLANLPPHSGGLLPVAFGLFHPSAAVRENTVDFLTMINAHPTGSKFIQGMNAFHRLALARHAIQREISNQSPPFLNGHNHTPQRYGHARNLSNTGSQKSHTNSNGSGSGEGLYGRSNDKEVPPLPPLSA